MYSIGTTGHFTDFQKSNDRCQVEWIQSWGFIRVSIFFAIFAKYFEIAWFYIVRVFARW